MIPRKHVFRVQGTGFRKFLFCLSFLIVLLFTITYNLPTIHADEIDDLQAQMDKLNHARQLSVSATKPLEGQLGSLQTQLNQIQASLANLTATIKKKEAEVNAREEKLLTQQVLLNERVKSYYIRSFYTNPLIVILSAKNTSEVYRQLLYILAASKQDKTVITAVASEIKAIAAQKVKLEKDKVTLASLQVQVDANAKFLNGEITKAKAYQADLSNQIAQISAKQASLIAAKQASLNLPKSAYGGGSGCVDDRNVNPGFSPAFAFFTYGVPNRIGLNQYGAKGRAEAGQNYETILKAYYDNFQFSDTDTGRSITVRGTNEYGQSFDESMNIEEYTKHIYEMPTNWNSEALKAQAIAARTYGLYASSKGFVYPSQQDQVVKKEINSDAWKSAVDATKGKIMTHDGQPIAAWFSSTHGGYVFTSGDIGWSNKPWTKRATDTTSGSAGSFSDLQSSAYDKASPWFYCDWGARASANKTAWLKSDEVADIANVIMLAKRDSGTQNHLAQLDKPNPDGTDTWDKDKVKQELKSRGGSPFNSVSGVSVSVNFGQGTVGSVSVSGDGRSENFDRNDFVNYFNLRAPANIQIVGPLFNIEHK